MDQIMESNRIIGTDDKDQWMYIDSSGSIYVITAEVQYNILRYIITNEKLTPSVLNYWWEVMEYFERID